MKVLLVEPPPIWKYGNQRSKGAFGNLKTDIRWPPIDLMVIAGHLRRNGHVVSIIDAGGERLSLTDLQRRLSKEDPQLVIVNTSTTTIFGDINVIRQIKHLYNDKARVGAIGVHIMALPEETMRDCPHLDFAVFSESETPILGLANSTEISQVNGIIYRNSDTIIKNPPESPISNMDELGIPAHDLVPLKIYKEPQLKRRPMSITMVSRGCTNRCIFCSSYFYGRYRVRSVGNVMEELGWITKDLGVRELKFYDDGITYDRAWAESLFSEMLKNRIDLTWNTNLRADTIDYDLATFMKATGCHTVNIGLESAGQKILDNIHKNITVERMEKAVTDCKRAGLEVCGYFVMGLPGETSQTVSETIEFAKRLDLDLVTFNVATPHPGTLFFQYLKENGYLRTMDWSKYDTNSAAVYDIPGMNGEEIYGAALKAYRAFYMRPSYFWKRLRRVGSLTELVNLINNFRAFMNNFILKGLRFKVRHAFGMSIDMKQEKKKQDCAVCRK